MVSSEFRSLSQCMLYCNLMYNDHSSPTFYFYYYFLKNILKLVLLSKGVFLVPHLGRSQVDLVQLTYIHFQIYCACGGLFLEFTPLSGQFISYLINVFFLPIQDFSSYFYFILFYFLFIRHFMGI